MSSSVPVIFSNSRSALLLSKNPPHKYCKINTYLNPSDMSKKIVSNKKFKLCLN